MTETVMSPPSGSPRKTGGNHIQEHSLDVVLARISEDLQEYIHIWIHGLDVNSEYKGPNSS